MQVRKTSHFFQFPIIGPLIEHGFQPRLTPLRTGVCLTPAICDSHTCIDFLGTKRHN